MYLSLVCAWLQGGFVLSCCNLKVLLWKWKPLRWWPPETLWYGRPWGDCFQLQVSQQIIKVKIIAVQPQRMAGISLQEVWKSDSKSYFQLRICYYFKWIFFSDSSLEWRSHPQEGLYDSHFFPSGFRCLWLCMKGNNKFEYFLNLVLDGVVLTVAAVW